MDSEVTHICGKTHTHLKKTVAEKKHVYKRHMRSHTIKQQKKNTYKALHTSKYTLLYHYKFNVIHYIDKAHGHLYKKVIKLSNSIGKQRTR